MELSSGRFWHRRQSDVMDTDAEHVEREQTPLVQLLRRALKAIEVSRDAIAGKDWKQLPVAEYQLGIAEIDVRHVLEEISGRRGR